MAQTLLQQGAHRRVAAALGVIALLGVWLAPGRAHADIERVWKTIETPHFVIHYYEPLYPVARRVAASAERSHALLSPVFGHVPDEKTQIAIVDDTDGANGFANVVPRNRIRLFATAPTSGSTLNDHDHWLFGLTAHEYTHVLHLDSIGGLPRLYNKIFGKQWAPNQVQPRWVIEGIATYEESKQTSSGRVRSANFDMNLRVVTLANERLDLDAVTNGPRAWPQGNAAYLYGSHFLDYVFDRYGHDKLREMTWNYGSNPIPYGLNRSILRAAGKTFEELYADWLSHLRARYSLQVEAAERAGLRAGRRLTFSSEGNYSPRYTRDGRHLVWLQSDGYSQARFRAMPVGQNIGQATDYAVIRRAGGFDFLADGSMVVEQTTTYRTEYNFQDLYRWDRKTGVMTELTHGLRAREPAVSPDESRVAFVVSGESESRLAVMPLVPHGEHRILWEGEPFAQASTPEWSPDGRLIAFTTWTEGGYRDIRIVDVETGAVERVTADRAIDLHPVFSPDGAYLYYVSDRSGIYNVYAQDRRTGKTWQVTNVLGGALSPHVSRDGTRLAYHGFGVGGYDIYEIDLVPERWTEPVPYVNDRPDPVVVPEGDDVLQVSAPRPYRPLETMAPQSYTLQYGQDSFGATLGVSTRGGDVVGHHVYTLGATLGLERKDVSFGASYSYGRLWPALRLAAVRDVSRRGGLFIDNVNTPYTLERYSATASARLPVLSTADGSGEISVDYDVDYLRNAGDERPEPDPGQLLPRYPETGVWYAGLALRWSYSDAFGHLHTVGPQQGTSLSAAVRMDHPALGSSFRALSLTYRWETFAKLPWGPATSLSVRLVGGLRASDRANAGSYSLGGVPRQDIVDSVINSVRYGATGFLRGYPVRAAVGRQYHLANLEYRQPLLDLERGLSTLPVYVRRLHWAFLLDAGNAFDDGIDLTDFKVGAGAALRLDLMLGYFMPGTLDIGYARGLTAGGIDEYWMLLTGTL